VSDPKNGDNGGCPLWWLLLQNQHIDCDNITSTLF